MIAVKHAKGDGFLTDRVSGIAVDEGIHKECN